MVSIFFLFGGFLVVAGMALFATALVSVLVDTPDIAGLIAISAVFLGFLGGAFILSFRGQEKQLARAHAYALACAIWFIGPLFLAVPMRFGHDNTSWLVAYADTAAAFTTMGSTFIENTGSLPPGLRLWRAMVAWIGGLSTIAVVILVLAPTKVGGMLVGKRPAPEHRSGTQWDRIFTILTRVAPVYGGLTLALFLAYQLAGAPPLDALVLAFGTVSTAGVQLAPGDLTAYASDGVAWIAIIGMLAGGLSFLWLGATARLQVQSVRAMWESFVGIGIILATAGLVAVALTAGAAGAAGLSPEDLLRESLMTAVSLVTTAGYSIRPESFYAVPIALTLFLVVTGGATVSTAGGFKLFRLLAMLRQSGRELGRLIYPHSVTAMRVGDQGYDMQLMKAIWAAFACTIALVGLVSLPLSLDIPDYVGALIASVAAVSTIGPLYEAGLTIHADWPAYSALSAPSKIAIVFAMILGRLEILAVLSLLNLRLARA